MGIDRDHQRNSVRGIIDDGFDALTIDESVLGAG
jgi:hypothetical protein